MQNEYININYNATDQNIQCEYINRLKTMLSKDQFNIYTIEKMLDSCIQMDIKDLNEIKNNIKKIDILISNCNSIKDVYILSKSLTVNFKEFSDKVQENNQIQSIILEGIDEDRIIELQDTINDHKKLLKNKLEEVAQEYRNLFTKGNELYKTLNDDKKSFLKNIFAQYLDNINQITLNDNGMIQESCSIFDVIFKKIGAVTGAITSMAKHYWITLLGLIGIDYFLDGYLSEILKLNVISNKIYNGVYNTFILFMIMFATCVVLWIYKKVKNYKYKKENEDLAYKLKTINIMGHQNDTVNNIESNINDHNMNKSTITSNVPENVEINNFKGFDNTSSYVPDDSDLIDKNDKYSIF